MPEAEERIEALEAALGRLSWELAQTQKRLRETVGATETWFARRLDELQVHVAAVHDTLQGWLEDAALTTTTLGADIVAALEVARSALSDEILTVSDGLRAVFDDLRAAIDYQAADTADALQALIQSQQVASRQLLAELAQGLRGVINAQVLSVDSILRDADQRYRSAIQLALQAVRDHRAELARAVERVLATQAAAMAEQVELIRGFFAGDVPALLARIVSLLERLESVADLSLEDVLRAGRETQAVLQRVLLGE